MKKIAVLLIGFLFVLLGQLSDVMAAPFYEGKVISLIVGSKPGGGYDRMARLVGKYLPRYIPGNPVVIIKNMDGADGIICANYVYNIAKPDGLTIGAFNQAMALNQLSNLPGVRLDVQKFAWLGSTTVTSTVMVVRANLPYKTVADLVNAKYAIIVGAQGQAANSATFPKMLQAYSGINVKLVMYPSSNDIMLAIERGEADARVGSYDSMIPFIERGLIRAFVRGYVTSKDTVNIPFNEDMTTDKRGKAAMRMLSSSDLIGRPYVCPPGTPAELMTILRNAFGKMTADRDFRAEALKYGVEIQYTSGKEIEKNIRELFSQPPDVMAEYFKQVVKY